MQRLLSRLSSAQVDGLIRRFSLPCHLPTRSTSLDKVQHGGSPLLDVEGDQPAEELHEAPPLPERSGDASSASPPASMLALDVELTIRHAVFTAEANHPS